MAVSLTPGVDLEEGVALARSVGWDTTAPALRDVLDMVGSGAFAARDTSGRCVGMVTCAVWDDLAWIGMMVVAPEARRQGIGQGLLRQAIAHAKAKGATSIGLDATPAGLPLYQREGFVAEGASALWTRTTPRTAMQSPGPSGDYAIYPVSPAEVMELLQCDRPRFGANRGPWLAKLMSAHPQQSFVAVHRKTGVFSGHVFSMGDRIGPLVADSPAAAAWLLHAIERSGVPPTAIVATWNEEATRVFAAAGYAVLRPCTRMWYEGAIPRGRPETIYAIGSWSLG